MSTEKTEQTATPDPLRALVVDDREDVAMGLALQLKKLGLKVLIAHDPDAAMKLGASMKPEVVFLDIGLPFRSGYEVCMEMHGTEWGAKAYIVAVTGRNDPADLLRAANTGFDRHVVKPMNFGTLNEILDTVRTRTIIHGTGSTTKRA